MQIDFIYISVHEYLDRMAMQQSHPLSKEQIIALKKQFRKDYLKAYKTYHRSNHKAISISLTLKGYRELQEQAKEQGLKWRDYVLQQLFKKEGGGALRKEILPILLHALDLVEEALFEKEFKNLSEAITTLLHLKTLLV